jgi:uncharacterized protein YbjQ (UPF0145 family)
MLSTGNINKPYEIIGLVGGVVDNQEGVAAQGGCAGETTTHISHDLSTTYARGETLLLGKAAERGGNAVIFAKFDYRIAVSKVGAAVKQVQELYCYGTAVKLSAAKTEPTAEPAGGEYFGEKWREEMRNKIRQARASEPDDQDCPACKHPLVGLEHECPDCGLFLGVPDD